MQQSKAGSNDRKWSASPIITAAFPAIDRSISSGLSDAREALVNAVVDLIGAYKSSVSNLQQQQPSLVVPASMRLFPVYILALLKQVRKTHTRV